MKALFVIMLWQGMGAVEGKWEKECSYMHIFNTNVLTFEIDDIFIIDLLFL